MGNILQPIANIPITTTTTPGILRGVKGCRFEPGLWLNTSDMYLMIMSQEDHVPYPQAGFYDVPDKGKVVFITHFKPYQRSEYRTITPEDVAESNGNDDVLNRLRKWRMFVFLAYQGDPPYDFVPTADYNYKQAQIEQIMARTERVGRG
jgi:hypothetical protein